MSNETEEKTMEPQGEQAQYDRGGWLKPGAMEDARWAQQADRQQRQREYLDQGAARKETVVQVRLPGAQRTYAYLVPADWEPLGVGDWVMVPGNVVSPEGGKGRVESFGRDAYKGALKQLVLKLPPQDPWTVRMEVVRSRKEANAVWTAARDAEVGGSHLDALTAVGRERLAALEERRRTVLRQEAELRERWS